MVGGKGIIGNNASMRPRPEGRGERPCCASTRRGPASASMRPRPEGRGERSRRALGALGLLASMRPRPEGRGERQGRRRVGRRRDASNAATTRRPWRTDLAEIIKQAGLELQCGHDPKAVENDVARALDEPDGKRLQCGHDPKAVENFRPQT